MHVRSLARSGEGVQGRRMALLRTPHFVAAALGVVYFFALVATDNIGFTRDESFYFHAAHEYAEWFDEVEDSARSGELARAFEQEAVDRHWSYNPEHPVLMKTAFALSYRGADLSRGLAGHSLSMRLPAMALGALLISLVFLFAFELTGSWAGSLAAALSMALMPRFFFHSHLTCFDVPITTIWFAVMYAWWKSWRSTGWAWGAGILWGVALITKLNAFFIPFAVVGHWFIARASWFRIDTGERGLRVPAMPLAFFTMASVGPAIFYLGWPRHWFDTFGRIGSYLSFHLKHEHYYVYYFGENLWEPPFPADFPFVMTATTTPLVILLAFAFGVAVCLWRSVSARRRGEPFFADERATGAFLAINILLPFLIIARPSTPVFGGIKHWFTALPFMMLVLAVGVEAMIAELSRVMPKSRPLIAAAVVAAIALPAAVATATSHPAGTGYYNAAVGNFTGAADRRAMRQFWGYAAREVLPWLNENLPERASVHFHNTTGGSYDMYRDEGLLREDIRYGWDIRTADCVVYHYQKSFAELEYDLWSRLNSWSPTTTWSVNGVPMAAVYCRREAAEEAAPGIHSLPPAQSATLPVLEGARSQESTE